MGKTFRGIEQLKKTKVIPVTYKHKHGVLFAEAGGMRMTVFKKSVSATFIMAWLCLIGHEAEARTVREFHPGYVSDVEEERFSRTEEMNMMMPEEEKGEELKEIIFGDGLTEEFQLRYEQNFGRTDAERNILSPNRFDEYEYQTGISVSVEQDQNRKRDFGEYMFKRLAEHHVDQYAKSSPSIRPVYELKDKISNVKMEVRKGYKVRLNYSYSGNYFMMRLENPYDVETRLTLQMSQASFGPGDVNESIMTVVYPYSKTVSVGTHYRVNSSLVQVVGTKRISSNMSTSLTGSTFLAENDANEQSLILLGLTWNH